MPLDGPRRAHEAPSEARHGPVFDLLMHGHCLRDTDGAARLGLAAHRKLLRQLLRRPPEAAQV